MDEETFACVAARAAAAAVADKRAVKRGPECAHFSCSYFPPFSDFLSLYTHIYLCMSVCVCVMQKRSSFVYVKQATGFVLRAKIARRSGSTLGLIDAATLQKSHRKRKDRMRKKNILLHDHSFPLLLPRSLGASVSFVRLDCPPKMGFCRLRYHRRIRLNRRDEILVQSMGVILGGACSRLIERHPSRRRVR